MDAGRPDNIRTIGGVHGTTLNQATWDNLIQLMTAHLQQPGAKAEFCHKYMSTGICRDNCHRLHAFGNKGISAKRRAFGATGGRRKLGRLQGHPSSNQSGRATVAPPQAGGSEVVDVVEEAAAAAATVTDAPITTTTTMAMAEHVIVVAATDSAGSVAALTIRLDLVRGVFNIPPRQLQRQPLLQLPQRQQLLPLPLLPHHLPPGTPPRLDGQGRPKRKARRVRRNRPRGVVDLSHRAVSIPGTLVWTWAL